MTRFDIAAIGVMAATTVVFTLDMFPAVAQADATRCSAVSSDTGIEISLDTPVDLVGGGPGGGPHVLARADVAQSSGGRVPTVHMDFTQKMHGGMIQKGRSAASDRSAIPGIAVGCAVGSSRSSSSGVSTCSISGVPPSQTVSARILLPTVQKRADGGIMHEDSWEVSVVSRSASTGPGVTRITCSDGFSSARGSTPRTGYDLAVSKKV